MKRSKFSLSHYRLFTADMGELVPCGVMEVLPGDSIQHMTNLFVRMNPMIVPPMHPIHTHVHHWFVPYRLLWDQWEDFITGGPDGNDASVFPTISLGVGGIGSLRDYMGIDPAVAQVVSALPFRAYSLIWNEWYRDQDLQSPLVINKGSGNDVTTSLVLQNAAWEKDYFTTARPWPQKGPEVTIPLGTDAPVDINEVGATPGLRTVFRNAAGVGAALGVNEAGTANAELEWIADLSSATSVTINALREAMALQRYAEARARYGSRYVEYLRYLGVRSSDARLQRPEYLGGGRSVLQISEVLQTAPTTGGASTGVANLKGHGIGAMRSRRYRRFIEEHGLVLSLAFVRPKTMYIQGTHRSWNRRTREDFWQKELEHIGQQQILNKEIYPASSPDGVFGYQDMYDEYRRMESGVSGEFRDVTFDFWHMARKFATPPALNADFVKMNPTKRIFQVTASDGMQICAHHSIQARRMLSKKGTSFGL